MKREILFELLEKYAEHGADQFVLADILEVQPIVQHVNVIEIAEKSGEEIACGCQLTTSIALRCIGIEYE